MNRFSNRLFAVALAGTLGLSSVAFAAPFTDIQGSWSQGQIEKLYSQGIISGISSSNFAPKASVNRAELATILMKTLKLTPTTPENPSFADVSPSHWGYTAIETVKAAGYINGYPDGTFAPNKSVARVEALAILSKAWEANNTNAMANNTSWQTGETQWQRYTDTATVPAWGRNAIVQSLQYGFFANAPEQGWTIQPYRNATRGEIAAMVSQFQDGLYQSQQNMANNTQPNAWNNSTNTSMTNNTTNANGTLLQGRIFTVPANTEFVGTISTPLSSKVASVGNMVRLTLDQPLMSTDNAVVIPNGSQIVGEVTQVQSAARLGKNATLSIQFKEIIKPTGERLPIEARVATETGMLEGGSTKGRIGSALTKTAIGAGLGAALGTAMGPLSGGKVGKGAIYGTAVGAGAGAVAAAASQGQDVELLQGEQLKIKLSQPIQVNMQ